MTTRRPVFRASFDMLPGELVVDNFAGGGGASTGIEAAIGRPVDIAINHSPRAIAMHQANHPDTKHFLENIWEVDPVAACSGRPVGLAWFSPDCTHFSRAKGTVPLSKDIRGLAWVVVRWAKTVSPRVIVVENVEEFRTWGPLGEDGRPDVSKTGETFREWIGALSDLGYLIDFRTVVAADHGAPTTRKRLFLVARRDRRSIAWPSASHGKTAPKPWRTAAEIIDWSLPCPSIFARKRPLAQATLNRIAAGLRRYVFDNASPFIVPLTHQGPRAVHGIDEPVRTVTGAHRGELALCDPFIVRHGHYSTISGAGLREGCGAGTFRGQPLGSPLATVCATNDKHIVAPIITKHFGGPNGHATPGHRMDQTLGTVTAKDHHALTAAFLTKFYGTSTGSDMATPVPTVLSGGGRGGGHIAKVRAFLRKHHGPSDRPGVLTIAGDEYVVADIGMRMLQPHELFAAQGFPPDYQISPLLNGKPLTKTDQTALAGNSVCPQAAEAIVTANVAA